MKKPIFKFKSFMSLCVLLLVSVVIAACGDSSDNTASDNDSNNSDFPSQTINGTISFAAGGATDNISRTFTPYFEEQLGQSIVLTNRPGASGATGVQYVDQQSADGYNLLFGSESPGFFGIMDISENSFDDFYPINLVGGQIYSVVVSKDSEFDSIEDLIEYGQENPGELKVGTSGTGTAPVVPQSMLSVEKDIEFNTIPFDGEGPALTALLGGQVDVTFPGNTLTAEYYESGDIKILAVMNDEPFEQFEDVPAIGELYPEFNKYLPWGAFYGVWVKNDTPDEIKTILVEAANEAHADPEFQETLNKQGVNAMGLSGEDAVEYINSWLSTTAWLLHESGDAIVSPEELGIPKPE